MLKSFFKKHVENFQRFTGLYELIKVQAIVQENEYQKLKNECRQNFEGSLALFGKKVYSQTDEDGIIEEIFKRIPNNKTFIEIGIQTGVECNSLNLLLNGWKGAWVEGNDKYCNVIANDLGGLSFKDKLTVINSFIDKDNISDVFRQAYQFFAIKELDLFSLDIDGNDYYIMEVLLQNEFLPKVVCVEYNAKFEPPVNIKIKYNKDHIWDTSDYMGCSLQAYVDLFKQYGYTLVCCNLTGINAFFVRNEFVHLFEIYEIAEIYQPYRYYLSPIKLAQFPTLRYLRDQINDSLSNI
ncbi:MAG: hypothetical protein ABI367_06955 [Mucilaginibacter sp.]